MRSYRSKVAARRLVLALLAMVKEAPARQQSAAPDPLGVAPTLWLASGVRAHYASKMPAPPQLQAAAQLPMMLRRPQLRRSRVRPQYGQWEVTCPWETWARRR